jgi:hypothetical protein
MDTPESPASAQTYKDDDLVYVDPDTRTVVGRVEWDKNEKPKSLAYKPPAPDPKKTEKEARKSFWRKVYPWGTYKSMKRIFKLEGKIKDPEPNKTLEEVLPKALNEAFWKWE